MNNYIIQSNTINYYDYDYYIVIILHSQRDDMTSQNGLGWSSVELCGDAKTSTKQTSMERTQS